MYNALSPIGEVLTCREVSTTTNEFVLRMEIISEDKYVYSLRVFILILGILGCVLWIPPPHSPFVGSLAD